MWVVFGLAGARLDPRRRRAWRRAAATVALAYLANQLVKLAVPRERPRLPGLPGLIEVGSRRVHFAGCTPNPSGAWVVQQARNLSFTNVLERTRFLIHDRDSKFTAAFDELFRSEGIRVIRTPVQAPQANA